LLRYGFHVDSEFQNSAEFIVAVVGLVIAVRVVSSRSRGPSRVLWGDSVTSLSWIKEESCLCLTCFHYTVASHDCVHLPAGRFLVEGGSCSTTQSVWYCYSNLVVPFFGMICLIDVIQETRVFQMTLYSLCFGIVLSPVIQSVIFSA